MARVSTFTKPCGQNNAKGTKEIAYVSYTDEIAAMPQNRFDVVTAALGTPVLGDKKIYDEPWDFSGAPSGQGYWRSFPILINTGQFRNVEEGEIGGKSMMNEFVGFVPGNNSEVRESIDCLRAGSGCMILMVPDKNGVYHVAGSIENPLYVDVNEGGTGGDRVGYDLRFYADGGFTNMEYDADTHGIDIDANV